MTYKKLNGAKPGSNTSTENFIRINTLQKNAMIDKNNLL